MAYVGISGDFVQAVKREISRMKDAEENAFVKPVQEVEMPRATDDLIQLVWGEHLELKNKMPSDWLAKTNSLDIRRRIVHEGIETDARFTVKFAEQMIAPPGTSTYRHDIFVAEGVYPPLTAVIKYETEMVEIKARWKKVNQQIVDFLQSCKSLNEALKLWPAVSIYIPKTYLDRVGRKVEREVKVSAAQQALAGVDTDAAIAAATTARFMSTAQGTFNV